MSTGPRRLLLIFVLSFLPITAAGEEVAGTVHLTVGCPPGQAEDCWGILNDASDRLAALGLARPDTTFTTTSGSAPDPASRPWSDPVIIGAIVAAFSAIAVAMRNNHAQHSLERFKADSALVLKMFDGVEDADQRDRNLTWLVNSGLLQTKWLGIGLQRADAGQMSRFQKWVLERIGVPPIPSLSAGDLKRIVEDLDKADPHWRTLDQGALAKMSAGLTTVKGMAAMSKDRLPKFSSGTTPMPGTVTLRFDDASTDGTRHGPAS